MVLSVFECGTCAGDYGYSIDDKLTEDTDDEDIVLNCNYDKDVTPLYQMIEENVWIACYEFLTSNPKRCKPGETPRDQARTWVSRYEKNGTLRWSQLPLHAAIIFKAPYKIIDCLIKLHKNALKSKDDQSMLPLHLAFRYGLSDNVLGLILEGYPQGINVEGHNGKLPHECSSSGPNPRRGEIIEEYITQTKVRYSSYSASMKGMSSDVNILRRELEEEKAKVAALKKDVEVLNHANKLLAASEAQAKSITGGGGGGESLIMSNRVKVETVQSNETGADEQDEEKKSFLYQEDEQGGRSVVSGAKSQRSTVTHHELEEEIVLSEAEQEEPTETSDHEEESATSASPEEETNEPEADESSPEEENKESNDDTVDAVEKQRAEAEISPAVPTSTKPTIDKKTKSKRGFLKRFVSRRKSKSSKSIRAAM